MGVVRVEPDDRVKQSTCDGCGGTTWMILGYVYEDEQPAAIYYVDWCEGEHDARRAVITLSVGNYADDDATAADRLAFAIETGCEGMSLAERPMRDRPDFLGRFVPRAEALQSPQLERLWHICDHLLADRRFAAVAAWLCGHLDTALDADDDCSCLKEQRATDPRD
jgi:hypothetical protein